MRILHITSEFTKKNFSIASLIIYISNFLNNKFGINFFILASHYEKDIFDLKNNEKIEFKNLFNFFSKLKYLINKILNYEIVHIHGIWAPIQLISIILCNLFNKKYVIHPHGMLLKEALKSGGLLKFCFKMIFLFFFKYLISSKAKFLAITNQEFETIKKFFPKNKIEIISNPIPFEKHKIDFSPIKKQFVYFGRIHPHKNIHLIVEAFKSANLDQKWKLKIYGIKDDENYYLKLKKLTISDPRIEIKEPVFGKEKQKILTNSWINILVSKSEVLSLSILESGMCSLPSLVNKNLELTDLEKFIISTEISISNIKKNLEILSSWTHTERLEKGKNISQEVIKTNSIEKISLKYNNFYKEFFDNKIKSTIFSKFLSSLYLNKNLKFLILTGNYTFNLLFTSFVVVTLVIFGHYSVAGELGLVASFWITFTQIFSSNMRSIVISENKVGYAFITMIYRLVVSILIFFFLYFFVPNIIKFENFDLVILFSVLILVQWIFEMNLAISEVNKKYLIFNFLTILNFVTTLVTVFLIYFSKFNYFIYLISSYVIIVFIVATLNSFDIKLNSISFNLKTILKINIQTIAFLSSFAIVISSFVWRIVIYFLFDKSLAGIFFACFSIGSFPGTVFNTIIGPTFVKEKIYISKYLKILFIALFIVILSIFLANSYFVFKSEFEDYFGINFISLTISISLLGSFFMCYAMYLRHKKIQNSSLTRINLFQRDIFYGSSIVFLIPVLYYFGNVKAVSFSFFVASILAFFTYSLEMKLAKKNDNI